jgi:CRISPR-associated Csx2 family protein
MAKVLISLLGTGGLNQDNKSNREYRTAPYKINDKIIESSFVTSVLTEELTCDKVIIIGTMKSMWEEVYRFYAKKNNKWDEGVFYEIAETAEGSNHESDIDYSVLSKVEDAFITNSKIILIKYGLNETELQYNFKTILKIEEFLEQGDELHIDITHSFRSLSVFMMTALYYLQDVSDKKLQVEGLYYGMLDIIREVGYAPIVNMKYLIDTMEWIKGAYTFQNFGNGYLISKLLKEKGEENLSKKIINLSNAFGINYASSVKSQLDNLDKLNLKNLDVPESLIVPKVFENFKSQFKNYKKDSHFQIELAEWYYDNQLYDSAYILLAEALITFVCEKEGASDVSAFNIRKDAQSKLKNSYGSIDKTWFNTINQIRNDIAHASIGKRNSILSDITHLRNRIEKAKHIIYLR